MLKVCCIAWFWGEKCFESSKSTRVPTVGYMLVLLYHFRTETHLILSISITTGYRTYFTSAHWAWEMFYSEKEMRRTRNTNELKHKHLKKSSIPLKSVLIIYCETYLGLVHSNFNSNKHTDISPMWFFFFFCLFFNHFASSTLNAISLRMQSIALYSKNGWENLRHDSQVATC